MQKGPRLPPNSITVFFITIINTPGRLSPNEEVQNETRSKDDSRKECGRLLLYNLKLLMYPTPIILETH